MRITSGTGRVEIANLMTHFSSMRFSGDPYALGLDHGRQCAEGIHVQVTQSLPDSADERTAALQWCEQQLPGVAAMDKTWIDEMRGMADGSGNDFLEIVALQLRPGSGRLPGECTSAGVCPDATTIDGPLCGQNRDLPPAYRARMIVMELRPQTGPAMLFHGVPGELAGVGLNEHGVCLFANSLWCAGERNWMAPPVVRRLILQSSSAEDAVRRIKALDGPPTGNYLIVDARGHVCNVEVLPPDMAVQKRDQGVLAHANNCLDPELARRELDPLPSPGSASRCRQMQQILEEMAPEISLDGLKQLFANHDTQPETICRHAETPDQPETTSCLIAEPADRRLHLSYGPPCEGGFATYSLTSGNR